jgi:hypothetical protein
MNPWEPIATHGDSEEQVRQAILDYAAGKAVEFRLKLRAEGVPIAVIEKAMATFDQIQREQIEKDLPVIMKNMAVTAGARSLH